MASIIYIDRAIFTAPGLGTYPINATTGNVMQFSCNYDPVVSFVDGNTLDNTISGFCYGNKKPSFDLTIALPKIQPIFDYIDTVDISQSELDIILLMATAGGSAQLNLTPKLTFIACAPAGQQLLPTNIGTPVHMRVSFLATSVIFGSS